MSSKDDEDENDDLNQSEIDSSDYYERKLDSKQIFLDRISRYLDKLEINDSRPHTQKLKTLDLSGIASYMKNCKNIICMTGAGISTSAGIPDFRSPNTGLYSRLRQYDLPDPEAIFDMTYFRENPKPFFEVAKQIFPANFYPTPSHYFLRLLHDKGQLLRVYSQNIDMLEQLAGIPESKIINAHGSFNRGHCIACYKEYSFEWLEEKLFDEDNYLSCDDPDCEDGVVKPNIIFFGETLPQEFFTKSTEDFDNCDLLLILGTSLSVRPFCSLTIMVNDECPRLLINKNPVGRDMLEYDNENNYRDVFYRGSCDEACTQLTDLLGWSDDLFKLIAKNYENEPS